ncbi:MAG: Exodeoxyribonuclease 7 small subunit [Pelotomaculum sp. PtaU1.Bin035]|nr:MAG: Exodeoxyribonuclease 7 small subunit [Pelotomaculum sp. PtaU1.Bin035]
MAAEGREMTFEETITRLEAVVREFEDGRLPLEKALELFAEGIMLSRICNEQLAEAEQRISILTADEEGEITLTEADAFPAALGGRKSEF